jgi:DNA-binding response OmpR family regulator
MREQIAVPSDQGPILIIEDDRKTASLIALYLEREGFRTLVAHDGETALELAGKQKPIFVVLDLMLPRLDGWEVCRQLRKDSDVPILILTARDEEVDRVSGLTLGADDYVVKPFSPRELVARIKAVLRRQERGGEKREIVESGDLRLDSRTQEVSVSGKPVVLSTLEFKLLHFLASHPRHVFSRDRLLDEVWGQDRFVTPRTVDVHIRRLREKIEAQPDRPRFLQTVRGAGYRFSSETPEAAESGA